VINISNDFNIHNGWNMDYGALPAVDVNIGTVPETTTRRLVESLEKTKGSVPAAAPRYPEIGKAGTSGEIGLMDLALAFAEVTKDESMCITGRPLGWPSNANVIDTPMISWAIRVAVDLVLGLQSPSVQPWPCARVNLIGKPSLSLATGIT
jgi:acetolactate synthase-1/2/3 large subunit